VHERERKNFYSFYSSSVREEVFQDDFGAKAGEV
jgi:hypothetical protein